MAELTESQDAPGLKAAIETALKSHELNVIDKLMFLASDGASVNSGLKSGLITLLKEEHPWVSFIWCVPHWLELALKDSLNDFIKPLDDSLRYLYYLYKNSSKKIHELKALYKVLEKTLKIQKYLITSRKSLRNSQERS